ncbi:MAG: hypothetical protein IH905_16020 [Proteobacteria bacterium]|nr:hypothetical protein [Pseudomonadota bacterium]
MNRQPDFEPFSEHQRQRSMSPARKRARILRGVSLVLLFGGFILVITNPTYETPGKIIGVSGLALYLYAWVLRFRTRGE